MNKHLKIVVFINIILIYSIGFIYPQAEQYKFRHLTTEDGMPNNFAYKIFKDSKGFIWITTRGGLCRYDGYNFKVYMYDPDDSTSISNDYHKCNITEDSAGYLWVGSNHGLNKFDPVTETFKRYYYHPDNPKSLCGDISFCIYCDREGAVWIGGINNAGLNRYNPETDDFTIYRLHPDDSINYRLLWGANRILGMYEDREGIFWLGTSIGLYQFDRQTCEFTPSKPITPMSQWIDNRFSTITEDKEGKLFYVGDWIYTYDRAQEKLDLFQPLYRGRLAHRNQGFMDIILDPNDGGKTIWITKGKNLYKFDRQTGRMDSTCYDPMNSRSIIGNGLKGMYLDVSGRIWVAGSNGINIMENENTGIKKHVEFVEEFNDEAVSFLKDSDGFWWIGTAESGLLKFDSNMKLLKWYKSSLIDTNSTIFFGSIPKIIEDRDHNLWIICNTDKLYFYDRELDQLKPGKQFISNSIHPRFIFDIYEDSQGVIWIAARPGVYYHSPGDDLNTFHLCTANSTLRTFTSSSIIEDHLGNLWISVLGQGLYRQPAKSRGTDEFISYIHDPDDTTSISNNIVWKVYEDNTGTIWASTTYGLNRYDRTEDNFERIIFKNDIGANFVNAIMRDENGYLWLASESGLMMFDPEERGVNNNVNHQLNQFIPFKDFSLQRLFKDESGKLYVPARNNSGNGYFSFYPDSLTENRQIPPIVITDFLINNSKVKLDSSINIKKHLRLNYSENYISFEFTALDYTDPSKNQYAYMLEGLDLDWIYSENRRFVTYTKIPAGDYTFRVKGSNNDGYWNETGTSIAVTIFPPPWKTWWAYTLYALLLIGLLSFWRRYDLRRQRLKQELKLEHVRIEKLEELDKMKSRFFANISHEFRTPLTLILGPLEKLRSKIADPDSEQDLNMMRRNTTRLQNLINQLLSLSKIESGKMTLKTREENIVAIINGYVQSFESLAKQKQIDLVFKSTEENIPIYLDMEKIHKILFNLLSNAFKFTQGGDQIEVSISYRSTINNQQLTIDNAFITISDTGSGISPENLPHIFDRFYQTNDSYIKDQEGTGIGLALVKELVELHYGNIEVESKVGIGTTFSLFLPAGKEHLKQEEIILEDASTLTTEELHELIPERENLNSDIVNADNHIATLDDNKDDKPHLLIVDDNTDLRNYMKGFLNKEYYIMEAKDGVEGYEKSKEKIPDLIISDLMMPKMDGYELCNKLKSDERTCHIPLIILTARVSRESRLEGLEVGADDFITKPFDGEELLVRVKNLIDQRKRLGEHYRKEFEIVQEIGKEHVLTMDEKFLQKARDLVENNISNAEYGVDQFASDMALSRFQLHRKLSALLNQSTTEFIRTIRLNYAVVLLKERAGTISEVAYDAGFNNPSYFSTTFKKHFGISPSEYLEKLDQGSEN